MVSYRDAGTDTSTFEVLLQSIPLIFSRFPLFPLKFPLDITDRLIAIFDRQTDGMLNTVMRNEIEEDAREPFGKDEEFSVSY